jgi:hypothetical protein
MSKARDLANAGTALTTVSATELGYLDGVTSAVQTQLDAKAIPANVINNTLADAKGDLITATADNTPARLAVGSNGDTLVADSSTSTGLRYQSSYPAGKNLLINGLLDIWQRSTSVTGALDGYRTVDRWYLISSASCTFAQEATVVPEGCRFSQKVTVGASASSTQAYQGVETSNVVAYAGKNITFSGRFQSTATPTVTLTVEYSNDVDKLVATGGWIAITATSTSGTTAGSAAFNTISGVYAIPSSAKSLRFSFNTSSMASGSILYYGGLQAELGVVVTSLVRNAATIQGELAACRRYCKAYTKTGSGSTYTFGSNALGLYYDANQLNLFLFGYTCSDMRDGAALTLTLNGTQGTDWAIYSAPSILQTGFTLTVNADLINANKTSHGLTTANIRIITTSGALIISNEL